MIRLEIDVVETPDGRYQARVYSPEEPAESLHLTPIPRGTCEEVYRDARAWIWEHHPDSNFGSFDDLD